jgi:hypothetical protein
MSKIDLKFLDLAGIELGILHHFVLKWRERFDPMFLKIQRLFVPSLVKL